MDILSQISLAELIAVTDCGSLLMLHWIILSLCNKWTQCAKKINNKHQTWCDDLMPAFSKHRQAEIYEFGANSRLVKATE